MTDHATPGELADRLDRQIAEWIADAIDGDIDHGRAVRLINAAAAAASAALLLGERQSQLDNQEK